LLRCNNNFSSTQFQLVMYLVAIAWIYVALMMAVAEATSSNGTVLGAIVTFVLYGLLPVSIVMYLLLSPTRRRVRKAQERAQWVAQQNAMAAADAPHQAVTQALADADPQARPEVPLASQPDASGHAPGATQADSIAPVRKEL
jgi:hypothetical protein